MTTYKSFFAIFLSPFFLFLRLKKCTTRSHRTEKRRLQKLTLLSYILIIARLHAIVNPKEVSFLGAVG
jgi:hypothetical protein